MLIPLSLLPLIAGFLVTAAMCMAQMPAKDAMTSSEAALTGHAAELYQKAQGGRWFGKIAQLKPDIYPTSDWQSFIVVWKATTAPKRWVVSLPGTAGFSTDDLAIWHPHLKDRDIGLASVQWWLGEGDKITSYYTPEQIYLEIGIVLQKLRVEPGTAMLHGFSRGSANSFAVMALDAGRGRHFFSLAVASSGGVGLDYPPTRAILDGTYGDHPLKGTRWITCAGGRDPNPTRDGIPGMKRTAAWLEGQGAIVLDTIEDVDEGHGALVRNANNARRLLNLFFTNANKQASDKTSEVTPKPVAPQD